MGERFVGALAVAPIGSNTPRELGQNDIEEADWGPSGNQMAVVRSPGGMGGTSTLEYPIGNKRYETRSLHSVSSRIARRRPHCIPRGQLRFR